VTQPNVSLEEFSQSLNESELLKFLNLTLKFETDRIMLRLDPIEERHRGGSTGDSVNGAVVAAICDIAVGATMGLSQHPLTQGSAVGRLDIRMRKPIVGSFCTAVACIEREARNLVYSRVKFFNESGQLCVEAQGTVYMQRN